LIFIFIFGGQIQDRMNNEDIERVANSLMEKNNVSVRRCRRHMDVAREPRINLITLFFRICQISFSLRNPSIGREKQGARI
jgi:hypothetical protein